MALGLNFLFRLGRQLLAGPVEESGLLPARYYASQALAALEEDNFSECLRYLRLQGEAVEPLVLQLLILRCRLLRERHLQEQQASAFLAATAAPEARAKYRQVQEAAAQALALLEGYLQEATRMLASCRQNQPGP